MKPLGRKAYGSIGHLPSSQLGIGDYHVHEGQAAICTQKRRDKHDIIIIQEKLDGSCCAVAKVNGTIHALTRKGYDARTSPFEQHHLFADWVDKNNVWHGLLDEGERIVGEWLAQAHGTIYPWVAEPFVAFDIMRGSERTEYVNVKRRIGTVLQMPPTMIPGEPTSEKAAFETLSAFKDYCPEGLIYRVERLGKVDFLAKWVRPGYVPGKYLPEISECEPFWNWRP